MQRPQGNFDESIDMSIILHNDIVNLKLSDTAKLFTNLIKPEKKDTCDEV